MNGVQTRFKCKLDVKRCKRFVFPPSSLLPRSNALKTKAIRYFQTDRTLTRIVSPPLLSACKKYREILSVLRQAEKQSPLSADLWSMKAMFEDYFGDSLTAQKNYRSADSAYAILIKEYATDSLKYASFRINRALNMALMTDNIAVLKEEVELAKKIFPETWKGLDTNVYGKNKKDFFDKCFNVRKK